MLACHMLIIRVGCPTRPLSQQTETSGRLENKVFFARANACVGGGAGAAHTECTYVQSSAGATAGSVVAGLQIGLCTASP